MIPVLTPDELDALRLSLKVSCVATVIALPLAAATALALARGRAWLGGWVTALINGLVYLPLILPPVVTGYVLLILFGRMGPIGSLLAKAGIVFAFDWTGAALAAGLMAFPLMVRAIQLGFEAIDPGLEQAAASLGAPPLRVLATITLPLAAPGIIAGTLLGFAKAMGEFGATVTFVASIPGQTRTLSSAIYNAIQTPGGDSMALRLAGLSAGISIFALILAEAASRYLINRRQKAQAA
jgi:molybdate transport system permease protein